MNVFVVITYSEIFSNQIVDYFKSLNPINHHQFCFITAGADNDEEVVIKNINSKLEEIRNLENVVVFSDAGIPAKMARRIKIKKEGVEIIRSQGSLIENGYLTFLVLNTRAPIEVVKDIINKQIEK